MISGGVDIHCDAALGGRRCKALAVAVRTSTAVIEAVVGVYYTRQRLRVYVIASSSRDEEARGQSSHPGSDLHREMLMTQRRPRSDRLPPECV